MWPDYYPESCPPEDAEAKEMTVFRLVASDAPTEDDFQPTIIHQPHRQITDTCIACGVSVLDSVASLDRTRRRFKFFSRHSIAKGKVQPAHGLIKKTMKDPGHHTWWVRDDARPVFSIFEVVMS